MYGTTAEANIRDLAMMFGDRNVFGCDSYGTRGMNMEERHEFLGPKHPQIREPKPTRENPGLITGVLEVDVATEIFVIYSSAECALYEHQKTRTVDWKPISSNPENEGWAQIACPINGRPEKDA